MGDAPPLKARGHQIGARTPNATLQRRQVYCATRICSNRVPFKSRVFQLCVVTPCSFRRLLHQNASWHPFSCCENSRNLKRENFPGVMVSPHRVLPHLGFDLALFEMLEYIMRWGVTPTNNGGGGAILNWSPTNEKPMGTTIQDEMKDSICPVRTQWAIVFEHSDWLRPFSRSGRLYVARCIYTCVFADATCGLRVK